jgi:hypothetical protein
MDTLHPLMTQDGDHLVSSPVLPPLISLSLSLSPDPANMRCCHQPSPSSFSDDRRWGPASRAASIQRTRWERAAVIQIRRTLIRISKEGTRQTYHG